MNSLHATPHTARIVLGTLTALILLAAMSAVAATAPINSDQFAPGWQQHTRRLVNMGIAPVTARDKWYVPGLLPRGEYVLVRRNGDKAELIDGVRFTVRGNEKQYLYLDPGYGDVEAIPVEDVPALRQSSPKGSAALQ